MIYRIYYRVKDGTGDYELIQMPVGTAGAPVTVPLQGLTLEEYEVKITMYDPTTGLESNPLTVFGTPKPPPPPPPKPPPAPTNGSVASGAAHELTVTFTPGGAA